MKKQIMSAVLAAGLILPGAVMADKFIEGFQAAEEHEYKQAMQKWEAIAKKGDPKALFMLGMMYHSGIAGQHDEKTAVILYEKAAEAGNLVAQEYLAVAYKEGWFGLKKNPKKARYWEKKIEKAGEYR
jgi:TPR repeat protein